MNDTQYVHKKTRREIDCYPEVYQHVIEKSETFVCLCLCGWMETHIDNLKLLSCILMFYDKHSISHLL